MKNDIIGLLSICIALIGGVSGVISLIFTIRRDIVRLRVRFVWVKVEFNQGERSVAFVERDIESVKVPPGDGYIAAVEVTNMGVLSAQVAAVGFKRKKYAKEAFLVGKGLSNGNLILPRKIKPRESSVIVGEWDNVADFLKDGPRFVFAETVIPPFLAPFKSRHYAVMASRCLGVNPPSAICGRSLL